MDDLINKLWMLFGICLWFSTFVSAENIYGQHSAQPTGEVHTDPTGASCDVFSYSSSRAKFTKLRKNVTLPSGKSKVKVTGLTLGCNSTSAALYVLPLAASDADRWSGQFARCRLHEALPDTASSQLCMFSCDCPAEGCIQIQLNHMPKTSDLTGFTLCSFDIAGCEAHSCQNGATCVETYGGYRCDCTPGYGGTLCDAEPRDCDDHKKRGRTVSGQYNITLVTGRQVLVHCDMDTDEGGWTLLMRRKDGTVDFNVNWDSYTIGFGHDTEFWIGNDIIHELTSLQRRQYKLRIDLTSHGNGSRFATYDTFFVADETSKYELKLDGYSGDAGDAFKYHIGMKFTTKDQDNDLWHLNCAAQYTGGWWYKHCYLGRLTGLYGQVPSQGIRWDTWLGSDTMDYADMKIRPL